MVKRIQLLLVVAGMTLFTGCASYWFTGQSYDTRDGVSSSLVDYLYPAGDLRVSESTAIPRLNLPLRVGIAFVPSKSARASALSEATKMDLLEKVRAAFLDRDYIEHIEVIPDTYLRSSTGFGGMQQVARLYGVDVMALVSYDQVSASEDRKSSFLYWTIIGAYVVKGTQNEVQTFVDTAVFDVTSRSLLFRAPGIDKLRQRSTAVEAAESVRKGRNASFDSAIESMAVNLSHELDGFEARVQDSSSVAEVRWKEPGKGGSTSALTILLLLAVWFFRRRVVTSAAS